MKIKKIIAREGLILLVFVALGLAVYFIGKHMNTAYISTHSEAKLKVMHNMQYILVGYAPYLKTMSIGLYIAIFGYPAFALLRFIRWAIKTLRS